ncbi:MAG: aspartate--tRNA ligase [Firmicutes bacterium]|nr:aspartate--tRNA ligase [Bacillota bacterium]
MTTAFTQNPPTSGRTAHAGRLRLSDVGREVTLCGFVQRRRDLGGVIFVDLRDRTGIAQLVFRPDVSADAARLADRLRSEYVVRATGTVVRRSPESVNPKLETGEIEVPISRLEVLSEANTPPFAIEENVEVDESMRLRYRYLDLRRPDVQRTLMLRHEVVRYIRNWLSDREFLEIETPMLTRSTPEGARDYLVPARVRPGEFYALPQSPQLFKQLLMVAGFERYFQVVKCFRDEDLRADRQPEFTQVDIETSFVEQDELIEMMEEMVANLFRDVLKLDVATPFVRIAYRDAMNLYGSDKPDLRYDMPLGDVSDLVADANFAVFRNAVAAGGVVKVLRVPGGGAFSRKQIDDLAKVAARYRAKGLAWMVCDEFGVRSPIAKFLGDECVRLVRERAAATSGDLLLFVADRWKVACDALGALRSQLARDLGLVDDGRHTFAWITEFPLLAYDDEAQRYVAEHHPFTQPMVADRDLLATAPDRVRAQAYDLVLDGYEVGGGSMRIYQRDLQEAMFRALGFTPEQARAQFGFLLDAFGYGTPPHGGIAFGLDRLIMIMAGKSSLREVIAFPKTAAGSDLMVGAPSAVSAEQWQTLHIAPAPQSTKEGATGHDRSAQ